MVQMPELSMREAAGALGVSLDTVKRRVRRGDLPARRDGRGWWLVQVPDTAPEAPPQAAPDADVVQGLLAHITELTRHLDEAAKERAELRRLLAHAMQAQTALQALTGEVTSLVSDPPTAPDMPIAATRRPWWRRWLGG
jgi:excisionase family DNA binding protein